ncbi:hypothetical protein H0H92_003069 [Tricholoma furcatifolium]|nr:hypothetical protein H0H92_003069 [Tricholoma furcatifolium]
MASSLIPECTPLKLKYDACFNAWFEGYLEPAVAIGSPLPEREAYSRRKAAEFNEKCGKLWESYRTCIDEKGLETLLEQARTENPLKEPPPPPSPSEQSS